MPRPAESERATVAIPPPAEHPRGVRVGAADVGRLEAATREFRALDYRYGGGSCRDAVQLLLPYAELMLLGVMPEPVAFRLCTAVADLYNLSGWASFDEGRPGVGLAGFGRALELARIAGNDELVANVCYRIGRLYLHYDAVEEAASQFERGQAAAGRTTSMLARAILSANLAWAQARRGDAAAALALLHAARDAFAAAGPVPAPPWSAFFGETDLAAMIGTVHVELALNVDVCYGGAAIDSLTTAVDGYGPAMTRSRSLTQIWLATGHALTGELDQAVRIADTVIETATELRSERTKQRMSPLAAAVARYPGNADARDILHRIDRLRGVAGPDQVAHRDVLES
jgi:tetratricopeptide (TPR) repeat protein